MFAVLILKHQPPERNRLVGWKIWQISGDRIKSNSLNHFEFKAVFRHRVAYLYLNPLNTRSVEDIRVARDPATFDSILSSGNILPERHNSKQKILAVFTVRVFVTHDPFPNHCFSSVRTLRSP